MFEEALRISLLIEPQPVKDWVSAVQERWSNVPELDLRSSGFEHLAIICDGNRRSAQGRGLDPYWGHRAGVETIRGIMSAGKKWGINNLTFWVWSTENWGREAKQTSYVMGLAAHFLEDENLAEELIENQTRFRHLGRKDRLPSQVAQSIEALERRTESFAGRTINLGMDYGGLDEVARAVIRMQEQINKGRFNLDDLERDPVAILQFLDTGSQPKPDLVIRTGCKPGEIPHTSGFMPLQTTYAGWEFDQVFFPDLTPTGLRDSIVEFISYERRKGK